MFINGKLNYTDELSIEHTKSAARLLIKYSRNFLSFYIGDDNEQINTILAKIKEKSFQKKDLINENEFKIIVNEVIK